MKGNGWNDIGYNFLVDKYGQVFEGRYGGVDKNVIGAHAEGFNTGSVGVAVLGTYSSSAPPAVARTALADLLGVASRRRPRRSVVVTDVDLRGKRAVRVGSSGAVARGLRSP